MNASRASLLRDPRFRLLFAGQSFSVVGDRIAQLAIPFAVLGIDGSATDVGLVAGSGFVPFLLFSLLGGAWADRAGRIRTMLASDLVRFAVQVTVATLLLTGSCEIWMLLIAGFVYGTADAFFLPAFSGALPALAGRDNIQAANALVGLSMAGANLAGPAVGGPLIALLGPGAAIAVDAGTFVISAGCLAALRRGEIAPQRADDDPGLLAGLREGFAEVRSRPWIPAFLGGLAAYHVIVLPAIFVLGPVLAERDYDGAASWALVVFGFGVGSVLGKLILLRVRFTHPLRWAAVAFLVASCQAVIIGSGLPIGWIAALEVPAGVGVSLFFVLWESTLQSEVPPDRVSRVASYDYLVSTGLLPVGVAIAGPMAAAFGLQTTLVIESAVGIACALALLAVPSVRQLRVSAAAPGTASPAP